MTKEKLVEVSREVAKLLANNEVAFSDISQVFREVEYHLIATYQGED